MSTDTIVVLMTAIVSAITLIASIYRTAPERLRSIAETNKIQAEGTDRTNDGYTKLYESYQRVLATSIDRDNKIGTLESELYILKNDLKQAQLELQAIRNESQSTALSLIAERNLRADLERQLNNERTLRYQIEVERDALKAQLAMADKSMQQSQTRPLPPLPKKDDTYE